MSFYCRRFCSEFRVAVEEFGVWIRWDFLPELPSKLLIFGILGMFIWFATIAKPVDLNGNISTQTAVSAETCEIPQSGNIAISD